MVNKWKKRLGKQQNKQMVGFLKRTANVGESGSRSRCFRGGGAIVDLTSLMPWIWIDLIFLRVQQRVVAWFERTPKNCGCEVYMRNILFTCLFALRGDDFFWSTEKGIYRFNGNGVRMFVCQPMGGVCLARFLFFFFLESRLIFESVWEIHSCGWRRHIFYFEKISNIWRSITLCRRSYRYGTRYCLIWQGIFSGEFLIGSKIKVENSLRKGTKAVRDPLKLFR